MQKELPKNWRAKTVVVLLLVTVMLMALTNPTERGFRRFVAEYVATESGATLQPNDAASGEVVVRENYYLYSIYAVNIKGIGHRYVGMFGSFHNY